MPRVLQQQYEVDVPEGRCGDWLVRRFIVSEEQAQFDRARSMFSFGIGRGRFTPAGEYTALEHQGRVIMSDTPDEIRDHMDAIWHSSGHCLVNGLGLGMVANAMLLAGAERVTAVEKSADVIALVYGHWRERWGERFAVVHADALTWRPPVGVRYAAVWHDIWDSICGDNLEEMKRLHRRYGRRCDWQGSWARGLCEGAR